MNIDPPAVLAVISDQALRIAKLENDVAERDMQMRKMQEQQRAAVLKTRGDLATQLREKAAEHTARKAHSIAKHWNAAADLLDPPDPDQT